MTFREGARALRRKGRALQRELSRAEAANVADVLETARDQSSGSLSLETLRRAGHPFATRHGVPILDPSLINVQSGRFYAGWTTHAPTLDGDTLRSAVTNSTPEAKFLAQGTRFMVARPLVSKVVSLCADRVHRRRVLAIRRALKA